MAETAGAGGAAGLVDARVLAELRYRHAEPHRVHRTWTLVAERLALAEEVSGAIGDRSAFILAVLFRDAVADPRRADGAAQSIALMRRMLAARVPEAGLARAEALIRAGDRHAVPATDDPSLRADAALFVDVGLAVLGAPPARYDAHEEALRREHAHLPPDAWNAGRSAALRVLLWRDRIYLTDRFHLELERRARRNLERTLARLRA